MKLILISHFYIAQILKEFNYLDNDLKFCQKMHTVRDDSRLEKNLAYVSSKISDMTFCANLHL